MLNYLYEQTTGVDWREARNNVFETEKAIGHRKILVNNL